MCSQKVNPIVFIITTGKLYDFKSFDKEVPDYN